MGTIFIESVGTDGDVFSFIRIGRELKNRGHKVVLITHSYYEKKAAENNLTFLPSDTPAEYAQFINDNAMCQNPEGHVLFLKRHVLPHIIPNFEALQQHYVPGETLIIQKAPSFLSALVAEKLEIPRLSFFIAPNFIMTEPFVKVFFEALKNDLLKIRSAMGLSDQYNWQDWWNTAVENVGLWPEWFAPHSPEWSLKLKLTGFLVDWTSNQKIPADLQQLINESRKPVVINSSSSSLFINARFFNASIKCCETLGLTGLLVGRHKEFIPPDLPECVHFCNQLPFSELLPQMKAIIHHGGIGTSAQALAAGIPQFILSGGVDRPENARYLKKLGVGDFLLPTQWDTNLVIDTLNRVLSAPEIKARCQAIAERMKNENPMAAVCQIVESVLKRQPGISTISSNRNHSEAVSKPSSDSQKDNGKDLENILENLSQEKLELLAALLLKEKNNEDPANNASIPKLPRKEGINVFPASSWQEWFCYIHKQDPESLALNTSFSYRIKGNLNIIALKQSFNAIIKRHENLRTTFVEIDGQVMQSINPNLEIDLPVIELPKNGGDPEKELYRILETVIYEKYNFEQGPLMRLILVKLAQDDYALLWAMHHIIIDGISNTLFVNELKEFYAWFAFGKQPNLPDLPVQSGDYGAWQMSRLNREAVRDKIKYWVALLADSNQTVTIPSDRPRPPIQTFIGSEQYFYISKELSDSLKKFSQDQHASVFMTLLAALNVLIYRYTGYTDINIGSPVAERNSKEVENLICCFSNMIVLRTVWDHRDNFCELLTKIKKVTCGAFEHRDIPLQNILDALKLKRDPGYAPLFQIMFAFHNIFMGEDEQVLQGVTTRYLNVEKRVAQFDLSLIMLDDVKNGLYGRFEFNTDLYTRETIMRLIDDFKFILKAIVREPTTQISSLSLQVELLESNDPVIYISK